MRILLYNAIDKLFEPILMRKVLLHTWKQHLLSSLFTFTKLINVSQLSCLGSDLRFVEQSLLESRDHQEHDYSQTQRSTHDVVAGGAAH